MSSPIQEKGVGCVSIGMHLMHSGLQRSESWKVLMSSEEESTPRRRRRKLDLLQWQEEQTTGIWAVSATPDRFIPTTGTGMRRTLQRNRLLEFIQLGAGGKKILAIHHTTHPPLPVWFFQF